MRLPTLRMLLATTALVMLPGNANAESIKSDTPTEALAAYCQEHGVGSETQATLTLGDGSTLTGSIECEQEDVAALDVDDEVEEEDEDDDDDKDDSDDGDDSEDDEDPDEEDSD